MPYARSQRGAIIKAILQYAQQAHDDPEYIAETGQLPYVDADSQRNATKLYEVPSINQVHQAGGVPFLAVRIGKLEGYGSGGVIQSADMAAKGAATSEPYRSWEIFSLHPYDQNNPNYEDADADVALFEQVFNAPENHRLGGVPNLNDVYVVDATPAYIELMSGDPYTAAYVVVRTHEVLFQP